MFFWILTVDHAYTCTDLTKNSKHNGVPPRPRVPLVPTCYVDSVGPMDAMAFLVCVSSPQYPHNDALTHVSLNVPPPLSDTQFCADGYLCWQWATRQSKFCYQEHPKEQRT